MEVLSDCTKATDDDNHLDTLKLVTIQGGVFGAISDCKALLKTTATSPEPLLDREELRVK